jgi:two-component system, NtrC family, response regulator AtoC
VLITGESGSGKEIIARAIHHFSKRRAKSWVDVNCAAIPDNLLESELFGHERGAFSGADSTKPGLFEMASDGTLFLDEIGDLDPRLQVKLLRVLDGASYYRLGGVKKITVDVRIVTATNQALMTAIEQGRFRGDLFHRLSQIQISVPPLRERKDDIGALAQHFLARENPTLRLSDDALQRLLEYRWPGNVRELRNVVVRMAILSESEEIGIADLPPEFRAPSSFSLSLQALAGLDQMERSAITKALEESGGNRQVAADKLGISKRTLQRRIKEYNGGVPQTPDISAHT